MIRKRLSREAEVRILKMAVKGRSFYTGYPLVTHIHERDFDDWMAQKADTLRSCDQLGGLYGLGLDRVVVAIDGIQIYDTGEQPMVKTYTRMEKAEPDQDSREPTRCTWMDIYGRKAMVRHFKHRNAVEFCVPEGVSLKDALVELREVGMPSDRHKSAHMILDGRVLLDGEPVDDPDLVLEHGFSSKISLREWQQGHSVSVSVIYGAGK